MKGLLPGQHKFHIHSDRYVLTDTPDTIELGEEEALEGIVIEMELREEE